MAVCGVDGNLKGTLKAEETSLDHNGNLNTVFLKHIRKRSVAAILSERNYSVLNFVLNFYKAKKYISILTRDTCIKRVREDTLKPNNSQTIIKKIPNTCLFLTESGGLSFPLTN